MRRAVLFWTICIPARVYLASRGDEPLLRAAAAVVAYRWLSGRESGHLVGFFGGPAWWADERPVHGALWAAYALSGSSNFLWVDTAFGAGNWILSK